MSICCRIWRAELACEFPCLQNRDNLGSVYAHAYLCNAAIEATKIALGSLGSWYTARRLRLPGVVEGLGPWIIFLTVITSNKFGTERITGHACTSFFFGSMACFGMRSLKRVNAAFPQMVTNPSLFNVSACFAYALGSGFGLVVPLRYGSHLLWDKYRNPPRSRP